MTLASFNTFSGPVPYVTSPEPVELPFIQQDYQRSYSFAPNAVPIVGHTEFVIDQWGEEVYFPETYQSKYKYNLKLTPIWGANKSGNYVGF